EPMPAAAVIAVGRTDLSIQALGVDQPSGAMVPERRGELLVGRTLFLLDAHIDPFVGPKLTHRGRGSMTAQRHARGHGLLPAARPEKYQSDAPPLCASSRTESEPMHRILEQAIAAHARGGVEDAKRLYRQVLKTDPGSAVACGNLAIIAAQEGKLAEAEQLF